MESSTTAVPQFIHQNPKKRVFLGGSSSSGCKEIEVLEISQPIKRNNSKQKEVICHEIIDVDMEEDCGDGDVILLDDEDDILPKGKEVLSSFSVGHSNLANDESGSNIQASKNGDVDDFSSDLFYGEDEWIDTYYEDILFDDSSMYSDFDHMDIPPGIEAPFPWLTSSPRNNTNVPTTSTSKNSNKQLDSTRFSLYPESNSSLSTPWSSSTTGTQAGIHNLKEKLPSKWFEPDPVQKKLATLSTSGKSYLSSLPPSNSLIHESLKENSHTLRKRSSRSSGATYPIGSSKGISYPTSGLPNNGHGVGMYMPIWEDLPLNMVEPSMGSTGFKNGVFASGAKGPACNQMGASPIGPSTPSTVDQKTLDEILHKFDNFKKFDTVEDFSDHHFSKNSYSAKQPPKNWAKKIQDEWKILEKGLPAEIFVRVYESRMDLLRAVIVGAEGTPYHDGLFFFDVYFPSGYPNVPPNVHYHSGGLRINPNLYNCGKVCLSLLNTWSGSHKEKWIPGSSTMLQVLVSIQGLILNAKPYFNEPGYANLSGNPRGEKDSLQYNEKTFMYSLQTMVYSMRRPPKHFEEFVVGHFCKHARNILVSCKAYLEGAQVGCLVKGGVQDVDEGDKSCSQEFKKNLAGFIITLVNAFTKIGAKDCQEFIPLAQKANVTTTAAATTTSRSRGFTYHN
ncbi:hypothetical protein ACJIZ3_010519 [Penstemon smallii]|uniref:E2 ubiquitin-conjugating enzyme n=1 Tax=Penstemon smallii TaxID=265156 RepID=A0ABD3UHZ2_9LAMI